MGVILHQLYRMSHVMVLLLNLLKNIVIEVQI